MKYLRRLVLGLLVLALVAMFFVVGVMMLAVLAVVFMILKLLSLLPMRPLGKGTIVTPGQVVEVDYYEVSEEKSEDSDKKSAKNKE
tara:strand:- start:565 stop:822 length:258 start_codon:yes stop_codon:yes gene_type:complete